MLQSPRHGFQCLATHSFSSISPAVSLFHPRSVTAAHYTRRLVNRHGIQQYTSISLVANSARLSHAYLYPNQRRHASIKAKPVSRQSDPPAVDRQAPAHSKPAQHSSLDKLNPPPSIYPPPLNLPNKSDHASKFRYYLALGRAYASFYKAGLKAVFSNYKDARLLWQMTTSKHNGSEGRALEAGDLTRAQFQFIQRARRDIRKVPLFVLLFLVCGEFTPLVVLFFSGVVPKTCRIPKQVVADLEKKHARREQSFRELEKERLDDFSRNDTDIFAWKDVSADILPQHHELTPLSISRSQLAHLGRSRGLWSPWWDRLRGSPPLRMMQEYVKRWITSVELDDSLIMKHGGVDKLAIDEVRLALDARGLDILGKDDAELRKDLKGWMEARSKSPSLGNALWRPEEWKERKFAEAWQYFEKLNEGKDVKLTLNPRHRVVPETQQKESKKVDQTLRR